VRLRLSSNLYTGIHWRPERLPRDAIACTLIDGGYMGSWWVYNWTTWIPNIMEYGKQITLLL
jgi:hypothetical protein